MCINEWFERALKCYLPTFKSPNIIGDKIDIDNFIYLFKLLLSPRARDTQIIKELDLLGNPKSYNDLTEEQLINFKFSGFKSKKRNVLTLYDRWHIYRHYKTMKQMVTIPGIGRKIAGIYLNTVYQVPYIAVDTHVLQFIKKFWGLDFKNATTAEKFLYNKINPKFWIHAHNILFRVNKFSCCALKKTCNNCPFSLYSKT